MPFLFHPDTANQVKFYRRGGACARPPERVVTGLPILDLGSRECITKGRPQG